MVAYPAILDVPRELVTFLAGLLADERAARGTRPGARALSCGKQALFALVWFRERRDVGLIGRGLGISQATSYRYLHEAIDVLAEQAPDVHETLAHGRDEGWSHVVLDGKVVVTDRLGITTISRKGATIDAWYSGKTHGFGGNIGGPDPPRRAPGMDLRGRAGLDPRPDRRPHPRPGSSLRRGRPRPAHPGRPRLRRRRDRRPYPGQAAHRRSPARRQHPHPQLAAALSTLPRRTRLRPAHRPLARLATHHPEPQHDHQNRKSGPCPNPLRTRLQLFLLRKPHCSGSELLSFR